jgi:hypothetical protein
MRFVIFPICTLLLAACQLGPASPNLTAAPGMTAPQAVLAAADAAPRGVPGNFAMVVKRVEMVGPRLFLNSEADYRDQRNLSVAIQPYALPGLRDRLGKDLRAALVGRDIRVRGVARRIRIGIFDNRKPTGLYYYQTHVVVDSADQISIVG